jgi:SAM-dependent methyltransferase
MTDDRRERLIHFVQWVSENITGNEKSEAQIFLDRLFAAFGQEGVLEAGGRCEFTVRKSANDGGGTAFADCVWKPVVLIEMKKRGEDLGRHYRQAFDYWVRLVPNRPRYVMLCNFDEFWVYDFETQMDTPLDEVPIAQLPDRYGPLAFLFPTGDKPVFGNNQEAVTREAADRLALCFNKLISRGVERALAQRFILQTLVALFAEDIGLLEKYTVPRLLDECVQPKDAYDLLGGLFVEMNTPGRTPGGRFTGVDYFNGGVFAQPARVELHHDEVRQLREAARSDWSKVRPEIFGTLFEHSLDKGERHAFGAHFTSPVDIMKIVGPTIVEPWREAIGNARKPEEFASLLHAMHHYRVLDPACGSGNFLYIAYRELKRLEGDLHRHLSERVHKGERGQRRFGFVTARQFFGMDIIPFAVELAKVTMMIGRKLAIDELAIDEPALPLDNLDANFKACDALIDSAGKPALWPQADAIIGNPPYLGAKRLKPDRGVDYVNAVRSAYPDVPGMADYCVYWFRKAHDHLPACTAERPYVGRAGLVGTQNIRNNQSRIGGLDYIVETGTVVEAVDNQPWSGQANVHVSIANWVKTRDKRLLPKERRLWHKVEPMPFANRFARVRNPLTSKDYELTYRNCAYINSSLSDRTDVSSAKTLACNVKPQRVFQGQVPGHDAFVLSRAEARAMVRASPKNREVIYPFLIGRDLVTGYGRPTRWVIDFQTRDVIEASAYKEAFKRIKERVLPERERKAKEGQTKDGKLRPHHQLFLRHWWRHSYDRPEMISAISALARYIVCSRVTKRPIFSFAHPGIRPDGALMVFAYADDYSFGILQSQMHWLWFITKCSKLKSDFRYTPPTVFDMFPWPQDPSNADIESVAAAAREIRRIRANALENTTGGLREIYRLLELPGANPLKDAHAELDKAVLSAYGFTPQSDLLSDLLGLNLQVARIMKTKGQVSGPGLPPSYPHADKLISADCITADNGV